MIKVYYPPVSQMSRSYKLIKQGLVNNPKIELVNTPKKSDFIFLFYTCLKSNPEFANFQPNKTIFIDYQDSPYSIYPIKSLLYFKRSWVKPVAKKNYVIKKPLQRPCNFYHLPMAVMDEFLIGKDIKKDILLSCTLRPNSNNPNRSRVLNLVKSLKIEGKTQIGQLNNEVRGNFNSPKMKEYWKSLKKSRIIVTCNPSKWEGDFRTWEALASKALVFIDKIYSPMKHPLIDNKHCIFYEPSDRGLEELKEKILYFLKNKTQATIIAKQGFEFAMKYHRASNRIDEILDRIKKKLQ